MTGGIEHLLEQARKGDTKALSILYNRFLPGIFGYVAMRVSDRATAEDLTSEVFLQMIASIHHLKATDEAGFTAWLFRIARVVVAGYYRKHAKQPVMVPLPDDSWEEMQKASPVMSSNGASDDPAHWMESHEEWRQVVEAINALTEDQRQVLVGRLILGYDIVSVARIVGKQVNAVKALQFRALKSLQRMLGQRDELTHPQQKRADLRTYGQNQRTDGPKQ